MLLPTVQLLLMIDCPVIGRYFLKYCLSTYSGGRPITGLISQNFRCGFCFHGVFMALFPTLCLTHGLRLDSNCNMKVEVAYMKHWIIFHAFCKMPDGEGAHGRAREAESWTHPRRTRQTSSIKWNTFTFCVRKCHNITITPLQRRVEQRSPNWWV